MKPSPYYSQDQDIFRENLKKFIKEYIEPKMEHLQKGNYPSDALYETLGKNNFWACKLGPGPWVWNKPDIFGIQGKKFNYFHEQIIIEEMALLGRPAINDALGFIMALALPPVIQFGKNKNQVIEQVIQGQKKICLAITEPYAGSDVANIQCRATKVNGGYLVNGVKKWITTGMYCDYFVTAVRTGKEGAKGISLLLIERSKGVKTKYLPTTYSKCAGTSYVEFENAFVPDDNLLGKENEGFKCIVTNFNHERWMILITANTYNRLVVDQCFKYCMETKRYDSLIINNPTIRQKLAHMTAQVDSIQAWINNTTYQMNHMNYDQQSKLLAGPIALLKFQTTRVSQFIADEACNIFQHEALTQDGVGSIIEEFQKTFKFQGIYGGSEEIMAELGINQARKYFNQNAKL